MTTYVSTLSVETIDSDACLCVSTENENVLFDVGEGTQRLCVEHKVRLSKLTKIFITRIMPNTLFGIPGMLLTISDIGKKTCQLIGPEGIQLFWNSTKLFMPRMALNISTHEIYHQHTFKCDNLLVTAIPLHINILDNKLPKLVCYICETKKLPGKFNIEKAKSLQIPPGPMYAQLKSGKSISLSNGRQINPEDVLEVSENEKYFAIIPSFEDYDICNMNSTDGTEISLLETILSSLTQELLYYKHHNHKTSCKSVTNVLDIDMTFINLYDCIIHLSPRTVFEKESYQKFKNSFGMSTIHFMNGRNANNVEHFTSFISATVLNNKLNYVCPTLFPKVSLSVNQKNKNVKHNEKSKEIKENEIFGIPLTIYKLLPKSQRGLLLNYPRKEVMDIDFNNWIKTIQQDPNYIHIQNKLSHDPFSCNNTHNNDIQDKVNTSTDAKLVKIFIYNNIEKEIDCTENNNQNSFKNIIGNMCFLGTGCAIPSKYRNVTGILISFTHPPQPLIPTAVFASSYSSSILLDCGEGTWHQLIRIAYNNYNNNNNNEMTIYNESSTSHPYNHIHNNNHIQYGIDPVWQISSQLKVIWISHPHADHYIGCISVIINRFKTLMHYTLTHETKGTEIYIDPLLIIAPFYVLSFLETFCDLFPDMKKMYIGVDCAYYDTETFDNFSDTKSYYDRPTKSHIIKNNNYNLCQSSSNNYHNRNNNDNSSNITNHSNSNHIYNNKKESISEMSNLEQIVVIENIDENILYANKVMKNIGITEFITCQVDHCNQSYGVAITINNNNHHHNSIEDINKTQPVNTTSIQPNTNQIPIDTPYSKKVKTNENTTIIEKSVDETISDNMTNFKIVFSGDTRPCDKLIKIGQNANCLIHEATFDDTKSTEAIHKHHSTIHEAILVAYKMNAYRTILTHFSQRYAYSPPLWTTDSLLGNKPIYAYDFMNIAFKDLYWANSITENISNIFPNDKDNDECDDEGDGLQTL